MDLYYWLCEKGAGFLKYSENNGNKINVEDFKDYLASTCSKKLKRKVNVSDIEPIWWALNFFNITEVMGDGSGDFLSDRRSMGLGKEEMDQKFIWQSKSYQQQFYKRLKTGKSW